MRAADQQSEFVILYDVPWETHKGIIDILGEHLFRQTYVEGTLETPAIVNSVSWDEYQRFDKTRKGSKEE